MHTITEPLREEHKELLPKIERIRRVALRRILYGLYTLVKVHFAEEEEIYLPLLEDRLGEDEATTMFAAMTSSASARSPKPSMPTLWPSRSL